MRGVIYARYSPGPHQTEQSIEGQVADCQQYAEEHGIDIIEIYADRHVSGKSVVGRDEFQRMLRLVAGEPNATYVTINLGEIYIADNIKEKSFGLDGRLDELLPALREACEV